MKETVKKISAIYLVVLTLGLLFAAACKAPQLEVRLGQEFQLSPGRQALIADEDLVVEFVRVTQDSRCPTGVVCIQAGQVVCVVNLKQAGSINQVTLTEIGGSSQASQDYHNYHFVFNVLPYPEAGKDIHFENYKLVLKITRLE